MRRLSFLALAPTLALVIACSRTSDIPVNDFSSLVRNLQDAGFDVKSDPTPHDALFPFPQSTLIVEGDPMQVYTFNTSAEAAYGAKTISADGMMVDHIAVEQEKPVFYQKDAIIVVYTQEKTTVDAYLQSVLGPPVYPKNEIPQPTAGSGSGTGSAQKIQ